MDLSIEKALRRRGVMVEYANLQDEAGLLVKTPKGPLVIIKNGLPEARENEIALHELGHLIRDDGGDYQSSDRDRTTMESTANRFMLEKVLATYLAETGASPACINPTVFCECYGLPVGLADDLRRMLD